MRFRFVGRESHCGIVRINQFGQALDLDAQAAHDCITGRIGLVTEEEFNSADLTEDELAHFADIDSHHDAKDHPEFLAKKLKLHAACVKFREDYEKAVAAGDTFMAREEKSKSTPPKSYIRPPVSPEPISAD